MTILIKNILLIDGANRPAVKADVLVKNERIAAMGYFPGYKATEIIDGMGAYLAPGFIDINASSDLYLTLFSNPSQKDFLFQGITTIIGGQGGISLAPLLYGSLDLNKFYANPYKINVDWQTMEEFLKTINRNPRTKPVIEPRNPLLIHSFDSIFWPIRQSVIWVILLLVL